MFKIIIKLFHLFPFFVLRICSRFENRNFLFTMKPPYVTTCMVSWIIDLLLGADIYSSIHWIPYILWYVKFHNIPQLYAILNYMNSVNKIKLCFPKSNLILSKNLKPVSFSLQCLAHTQPVRFMCFSSSPHLLVSVHTVFPLIIHWKGQIIILLIMQYYTLLFGVNR
jgi:hypothetical protein